MRNNCGPFLEADIGDYWETYEAAKTRKGGKLDSLGYDSSVMTKEGAMKALALLTAMAVTLFSVAASAQTGPYYGKGKAPPPPVVTKG